MIEKNSDVLFSEIFRRISGFLDKSVIVTSFDFIQEFTAEDLGCALSTDDCDFAMIASRIVINAFDSDNTSLLGISYSCVPMMLKHLNINFKRYLSETERNGQIGTLFLSTIRVLLLFSPYNYTAWNLLKQDMVNSTKSIPPLELVSRFQYEFKFLSLIQRKYWKCVEVWVFRRWLFSHFCDYIVGHCVAFDMAELSSLMNDIFKSQLSFAHEASASYSRNYYSWTFRYIVLDRIISLSNALRVSCSLLIQNELLLTADHIQHNPYDYSCCHYRGLIFSLLIDIHLGLRSCDGLPSIANVINVNSSLKEDTDEAQVIRDCILVDITLLKERMTSFYQTRTTTSPSMNADSISSTNLLQPPECSRRPPVSFPDLPDTPVDNGSLVCYYLSYLLHLLGRL